MPDLTLSLSDDEMNDLEAVAETRGETPEVTRHDLLTGAVAAELADPQSKANFARGVRSVRRETAFADAFVRTTETLNRPSYPRQR